MPDAAIPLSEMKSWCSSVWDSHGRGQEPSVCFADSSLGMTIKKAASRSQSWL